MIGRLFLVLGALAVMGLGEAAQKTVLNADFQAGKTDGWAAGGAGDVRLTRYGANVSMRLAGHAMAGTTVSTRGLEHVTLSAEMAAEALSGDDFCAAEMSADSGAHWSPIVVVRHGQDDGVTLNPGAVQPLAANDIAELRIRLRASGGPTATCWADNIRVTGTPIGSGDPVSLSRDQLLNGGALAGPLEMAAFAPPEGAIAPANHFEGRLILGPPDVPGGYRPFPGGAARPAEGLALPAFDFVLVQDGQALIPERRGAVPSANPDWEWVLEPGAVWDQPGDAGFSRAAIPFALEERNANCLHNGVLTFLFKSNGAVSHVAYEIAGETCAYQKFDAWGLVSARAVMAPAAHASVVAAAYRAEAASRLPVRPLTDLERTHPGFDAAALRLARPPDGDVPSAFGLVADGVNYAAPCETRHGSYPYCDVLDLPSYSTAKTIFAAMALMRLEALRPGARLALITAHAPACNADAWRGVTFSDALNMATGVYGSAVADADEDAPDMAAFFNADSHAAKLAYACNHNGRKAAPGAIWVYHTTDTYLLGAAMADYVRRLGGGDLYDSVVAGPLWGPLKLSPTLAVTRRTYDAERQPFTGWGLTYHRDDILRIADWLRGGALIDGRPALDAAMLRSALQQDPAQRGLTAFGPHFHYRYGVWARDIAPLVGCKQPLWAPFMSGYGGISVVLMPNGTTFYFFGDSAVADWAAAAIQADKIKRMCP